MLRRQDVKYHLSALKPSRHTVGSKEALDSSQQELRQMLGPKIERIKKSQMKYLYYKRKVLEVKKDDFTNRDFSETVTLPNQTSRGDAPNSKTGLPSQNQQKLSHRFIGTASTRRPRGEHSLQLKNKGFPTETTIHKNTPNPPKQQKKQFKISGMSENKINSIRRRCKNINSHTLLSTVRNQKKEGRMYYVRDIKNSLGQFRNNQEFMDCYLTHFMEKINTFKLFQCSYLPPKPHRVLELPSIPKDKITLVFDLDQTLIHTQILDWHLKAEDIGWGKTVDIVTDDDQYQVNLKIRPHAIQVLQRLSQKFQLGILTAGQEHYAQKLLNQLDPDHKIFAFRLFRPHCVQMHSRVSYVKNLRVIGNRDLSRMVLIDNAPHSYIFQKRNGIPIVSFYEDQQDRQLLKLQQFLYNLLPVTDVRKYLHQYFKFEEYNKFTCMTQLIEELY